MSPIRKCFRVSFFLSVLPFCIYAFLYSYPSFSFFSYIDNGIFTWLWEMKWTKLIAFVSAPASVILLFIMVRRMRNSPTDTTEKVMIAAQIAIAGAYFVYWFVLLRIIFMI